MTGHRPSATTAVTRGAPEGPTALRATPTDPGAHAPERPNRGRTSRPR
ncbi:hypothetical protein Celf_0958 [Cellulomonas fimi ATCC 484]|uniref:Uncharacterized protein n=1 Tax=Cellulomonas fimi (strain ATCC 484 / DSM 20113 / JCM 1341 / CCUG 24087 / LMG 16345 / NBRC 15513 / NCIMB 8980 / NCTC 7547 / NRS-133) TaxID=590998 RepID=F4H1C4_CELFA|nr:hypothetical protein Celf_0958 [Cellulomonas fimi ATCC 484]VEH28221.1 Uncharacterised protein [Cellulomonas fimi]